MGDFLQYVSDEKVFLNYRNVSADDVTLNIELAKLEKKRLDKKQQDLGSLKPTKDIVEAVNSNEYSRNQQKISSLKLEDEIKYSTIDIYLKEPKERILELEIANVNSIEAKYKHHFWYDIQEGLATGWYLLQRIIVLFSYLCPILLMLISGVGIWKNRRKIANKLGVLKKDK